MATSRREQRNEKQKGKKKKSKKIGKGLIVFAIVLIIAAAIATAHVLHRYNYYRLDRAALGIGDNPLHSDRVRNIAIFGVDSRGQDFSGLSDTIMVVSLNYYNQEIKLISFMRDSIVRIDRESGQAFTRQNHAHSYGGPQLAIRTLNINYDLDIQDFITVNFAAFERIVDRLGGITINVQSNELAELNRVIRMTNDEAGGRTVSEVSRAGTQTLNGRQALAYSRIRDIGGDQARTDRNRMVMEQIISRATSMSHAELARLAYELMPYVQSSFQRSQIAGTVSDFNTFRRAPISEFRYPVQWANASVRGMSLVRPTTLETNVQELMKFQILLEK